ncbi:tyrosine-type recombinase/integrase [Thiomonas delicata]|uniref:Putative phage integrase n=1 Tax=Thiomonas delicata TaxID=364030 RepID=A0A238DA43_THIDL|nr:site-specific integrase [Thiomonas delicata]SBP89984.1 putative phage integrase [Thiomonas delicata]
MGTVVKRGKTFRAQVRRHGISRSATFDTKASAYAWVEQVERDIDAGASGDTVAPAGATFATLLEHYRDQVSESKRGKRWEVARIHRTLRDPIAEVPLARLAQPAVVAWRDRRLKQVSPASVQREWNLLSHACSLAVREWHWLVENPFTGVRRPPPTPPRDRLATEAELGRILLTLSYQPGLRPSTISQRIGAAAVFAVETGMRAGEIAKLTWADVAPTVATVRSGKTAAATRRVPLSPVAQTVLSGLKPDPVDLTARVFDLATSQLDSLWRKAKKHAMIEDLHFHDLRHTAVTRLAKKLPILDLARMIGHKDLRMLQI